MTDDDGCGGIDPSERLELVFEAQKEKEKDEGDREMLVVDEAPPGHTSIKME